MEPHTASRLRERKNNKIKDYQAMAGPLGVTHCVILSQTENSTNLRFACFPRGPTLSFQVQSYSLMKDVASEQKNPKSPGLEYATPPILIMNNFNSSERTHSLMLSFFQNMFPPLDVANMKLSDARRVLLLSYSRDTNTIEFRHYLIHVKVSGVSRSIKAILQADLPDLESLNDVSEFVLQESVASESEREDNGESVVTLEQSYVGKNKQNDQRRITLVEVGPRMTTQLVKIQDGFCDGAVMFHQFVQKTEEEKKALAKRRKEKERLKAERRNLQQQNVDKKKRKANESDDGNEDELEDENEEGEDENEYQDDEDENEEDEDENESEDDKDENESNQDQ